MPTSVERQRVELPLTIGGGIREDVQKLRIAAPNALEARNVHADKLGGIQRRPSWVNASTVADGAVRGVVGDFAVSTTSVFGVSTGEAVLGVANEVWDAVTEQPGLGVVYQMSSCVEYTVSSVDYVLCGWLSYAGDGTGEPDRNLYLRVWNSTAGVWHSDPILVSQTISMFDLIIDPDDSEVYVYTSESDGTEVAIRRWAHGTLSVSTIDTISSVYEYSLSKNSSSIYLDDESSGSNVYKIRSGAVVATGSVTGRFRAITDAAGISVFPFEFPPSSGSFFIRVEGYTLDEATATAAPSATTGGFLADTGRSDSVFVYYAGTSGTKHSLVLYSTDSSFSNDYFVVGVTADISAGATSRVGSDSYADPFTRGGGFAYLPYTTRPILREIPGEGQVEAVLYSRVSSFEPDYDFSGTGGSIQLLGSGFKAAYQLQPGTGYFSTFPSVDKSIEAPSDYDFSAGELSGTFAAQHHQYQEEGDHLFLPQFTTRTRFYDAEAFEHDLVLFRKSAATEQLPHAGGLLSAGQPFQNVGGVLRSAALLPPVRVTVTDATSPGTLANGVYQISAVLRDPLTGSRSAPFPTSHTLAGADDTLKVEVALSPLYPKGGVDTSTGAVSPLFADVYVSEADGSALYLAGSTPVDRSITLDVLSVDTSQPVLYTAGGELAAEIVPEFRQIVQWQSRYVGLPRDGEAVWPSKQERPEWAVALTIPSPEKLYAIAPLGGTLLGFGKERVWITSGDGPDATGFNGQWAPWQDLSTISPILPEATHSVCEVPGKGVMYQSVRGFTMITREGSEDPSIGDKVEDYTRDGVWECVYHDTERHTLYFAKRGGGTEVLALDTDLGEWFVHDGPSVQIYGGQRQDYLIAQNPDNSSQSLLLQPGTAQINDDYVNSPAAPVFRYRTAWFRPVAHLASQVRYTHVNVTVGDTVSPDHPYTIRVYTDGDDTTPTDTFTISASDAGNVQRGGYVRTRHQLSTQVANAICVEVEQAPESATGTPDFELVDITLSALVPNTLQPGWGADQAVKG